MMKLYADGKDYLKTASAMSAEKLAHVLNLVQSHASPATGLLIWVYLIDVQIDRFSS